MLLLEIFLITIAICVIIGAPFFILKVVRTAITEGITQGKQNITININQTKQKQGLEELQKILQIF